MSAGAELLNDKFDQLSQRFDLLYEVDKDKGKLVNAAISDWQDWFWENHGNWPAQELLTWQDRYVKTAALVDALATQTVTVSKVEETKDYDPPKKKVIHLPPLLITARPPPPPYVPPPPIVYEETGGPTGPAPARVRLQGMGSVDVSEWDRMNKPEFVAYSRDPGTKGWEQPLLTVTKAGRGGLIALTVGIVTAIVGKKQGWL